MLGKYNRYKLLKIFLFNPGDSFRLRELSRLSEISPPSVVSYIKEFKEEGLIKSYEKRGIPYYASDLNSDDLRFYKKIAILFELHESGVVEYLWEKLAPKSIILYGSYAKGEFTENSDVDLFVIGKKKEVDCKKFEEKLGKRLHLMFEENIKNIQINLRNNICNGVVLKGYLKVF